jgi:hypothetical protein
MVSVLLTVELPIRFLHYHSAIHYQIYIYSYVSEKTHLTLLHPAVSFRLVETVEAKTRSLFYSRENFDLFLTSVMH